MAPHGFTAILQPCVNEICSVSTPKRMSSCVLNSSSATMRLGLDNIEHRECILLADFVPITLDVQKRIYGTAKNTSKVAKSMPATPRTTMATPRTTMATPRTTMATPRTTMATPRTTMATPRTTIVTPRTTIALASMVLTTSDKILSTLNQLFMQL